MKALKYLFASFLVLTLAAMFTAPAYGMVKISTPEVNTWWDLTEPYQLTDQFTEEVDYIVTLDGKNQVYAGGGVLWRNVEVYSDLAIDPNNSLNMFEFHIQDRWSNGCGMELGLVQSTDGGATWVNRNEDANGLQICKPLRKRFNKEIQTYIRPSNPWLAWSSDGTHLLANYALIEYGKNPDKGGWMGVGVSISDDGGITWSDPIWAAKDFLTPAYVSMGTGPYGDYQTITCDPKVPENVYATWMRIQEAPSVVDFDCKPTGPLYFAKSTDYGYTWSNAKLVYAPGASPIGGAGHGNCWIGNILVNPVTGTLHLFTSRSWSNYEDFAVLTSKDGGKKWSKPKAVQETPILGISFDGVETEWRNNPDRMNVAALRDGDDDVALYCVFQAMQIGEEELTKPVAALARSLDDGASWDVVRIDQIEQEGLPGEMATLPRVAAAGDKVGVSYWVVNDATMEITFYLSVFTEDFGPIEGLVEHPVGTTKLGDTNDLSLAPIVSNKFFIGEHMGLQAVKNGEEVTFHNTFPQIIDTGVRPLDRYLTLTNNDPSDPDTYLDDDFDWGGDTIYIYNGNYIDMYYDSVVVP